MDSPNPERALFSNFSISNVGEENLNLEKKCRRNLRNDREIKCKNANEKLEP